MQAPKLRNLGEMADSLLNRLRALMEDPLPPPLISIARGVP